MGRLRSRCVIYGLVAKGGLNSNWNRVLRPHELCPLCTQNTRPQASRTLELLRPRAGVAEEFAATRQSKYAADEQSNR